MAGTFQVTPSALREKAGELRSQNKTLRSQIDGLRNQANSLNGMWEGEAHEGFTREFTKDAAKMDQFCSAIDEFANKLEMIAQEYEAAERKNTQTASARTV